MYNLESGKLLKKISGHEKKIKSMALFQNLLFSGSEDTTIRVWNMFNGIELKQLNFHTADVNCIKII